MSGMAAIVCGLVLAGGVPDRSAAGDLPRSLSLEAWAPGALSLDPAEEASPSAPISEPEVEAPPSFGRLARLSGGQTAPPPQQPPASGSPPFPRPGSDEYPPPHDSFEDAFETHFSGKAWRDFVWEDYLATPQVILPAVFAVSAAAISHWDKTLQKHWFGLLGDRGWYSDAGQYTLLGAVVVDGILFPGEGRNWWDQAWTIGESYGAASLTAFVLKTGVKRPRPGSFPGTGNGTHSFPSGHSTAAFTAATLIESNSGPLFGIPAYGLAGFTAFERVEEGRHFPSDILAGAAIGTLSAGIFDALHWGAGGEGGIARSRPEFALNMDGLKGFEMTLAFRF